MLKRTIILSNPLRASTSMGQLVLSAPDDNSALVSKIPIEDLSIVIIENQRVAITIPAINELTSQNVALIICDKHCMPSCIINPLDSNTLQGQRYRTQLEATSPTKKSIWKQIITSKIKNQSQLLNLRNLDGDILRPFYTNVKSDDSDNREGVAAKIYWSKLFGKDFSRSRDGTPPNNLLNYGYSVLRAATARAIVGAGMLPALGIHHHNRSNAFPLADDLMEPFRPFVDSIVADLFANGKSTLNKESKSLLVNALYCDTLIGNKIHPLSVSLTIMCTSMLKVLGGEAKTLRLPHFISSQL